MGFGVEEGAVFAGHYRIVRRLGAGAMGAVYEVVHLPTERRRALKLLHPHLLDRAELRARFELEARVSARVESAFIVDVLDAGVDEETGAPFLVMELLEGEDLGHRLHRRGRLSPEEALRHLHETALALDKTHRARIVHRDLKPSNLFVARRERGAEQIKVLDFGVAKLVAHGESTTATVGTPVYMAPEQLRNGRISAATDLYALGMVAYTLLVGEAYWAREKDGSDNLVAFALMAVTGPREPARARAARRGVELPEAFDAWFAKATAAAPAARFGSAREAVSALAEIFGIASLAPAPSPEELDAPAGEDFADAPTVEGTRLELAETDLVRAGEPLSSQGTTASRTSTEEASATLQPTPPRPADGESSRSMGGDVASPRRPSGRIAALSMAGIAALGIAIAAIAARPRAEPAKRAEEAASPLALPSSVLACPVLEASGVDEPSGWLGAAAAATICERARVILGGRTTRTLVPAELLGLPVEPSGQLAEDPYAGPDARARSVEAAQKRSSAYIDGRVVKDTSGFRVEIALRSPAGAELARGAGSGRALYAAVRDAVSPLVGPTLVPRAVSLDPTMAAFSRAPDVDGALALLDLSFSMVHNAGNVPEECARVAARSKDYAELGPGERHRCAYALGLPAPKVDLPPADRTSPGALAARARVRLMIEGDSDLALAAELEQLLAREVTPFGRSTLAASASCLFQAENPARSRQLALLAVQAEPKNPVGEWCAPWIQMVTVARGTAGAEAALRALRAWTPWDAYGWLPGSGDPSRSLAHSRRAYALSPLDTHVADVLAGELLRAGARDEARAVAAFVSSGGHPVHRVESDLLLLRVDASEARFRAALSGALRAMVVAPDDAGFVRVLRLEIAWRALQIAMILGRGAEIADAAVERFLDPEPSPIDGASVDAPLRIPAICARASAPSAKRCFARFRALRTRLSLGALPDTDAFTDGAERYAAGDHTGAAKAWRPLLRDPGPYAALMADAMIDAFERTGEADLVARLEGAIAGDDNELNGASPKTVRAARAAAKRGDRAKARALAKQVIDAWSVADEMPPAVEEMRRLAAGR
ncbi:MAG: serine/threonine-protein kinase [Minicystis sp.]